MVYSMGYGIPAWVAQKEWIGLHIEALDIQKFNGHFLMDMIN